MANVSKMYANLRGIQTAIKDVGRLNQIARVLARHGFGWLISRLNLSETIGIRALVETQGDGLPYTVPQRIRMTIEELGPTCVKLGQILSTRSDLVPADILAELQSLQDHAQPMAWDDVRVEVERELKRPLEEIFSSFGTEPLAAASVAQVHEAVLRNGGRCVVKVQRPRIAEVIESDLSILYFLARRAEALVPELSLMDPVGMVAEFDKALHKELDFSIERSHIQRFRKNFARFSGLRVPRVFEEHSTGRVLTMDYIEGVKVTEAGRAYGIDLKELARRVIQVLLKMVFRDGFFHGDPHPGNVLIDRDGTIGLIDFGLVGRLTPRQRENLLDVLIALAREDYSLVARTFFEIGIKLPGVSYDFAAFETDVIELMENHFAGKTLNEVEIGRFFGDLVAGAVKHQIRMPPAYTMGFKAIMTVEGIGKAMTPDLNLIDEARPFIREILLDRYSPRRLLSEGAETLAGVGDFLRKFPSVANQILREIEQGRLVVRTEVQNAPLLLEEQRRSAQQVVRAVLFGACVIAGTLALEAPIARVYGVSAAALLFYGLAIVLGWPLLLFVLRRF